jgi:hypothetical protein
MEKVLYTGVRRGWTSDELRIMRENARLGSVAVALLLGRSVACVRQMAYRQRISLRAAGERRGVVLGQPRGQSIASRIREDIVSGRVDAEVLARRMGLAAVEEVCPCCGRRPVEVRSTGFCLVCHKDRLTQAHLAEVEKLDAQRALWSSRQTLCRARKAAEA